MGPLPHLIPRASALHRGLLLALLMVSASAAAGTSEPRRSMQAADIGGGSGDGASVPRNHSQLGNHTTQRGQRAHHRVRPLPFCLNMTAGLLPADAARLRDLLQVAQQAVTEEDEARQMLQHNNHKGDKPEAGERLRVAVMVERPFPPPLCCCCCSAAAYDANTDTVPAALPVGEAAELRRVYNTTLSVGQLGEALVAAEAAREAAVKVLDKAVAELKARGALPESATAGALSQCLMGRLNPRRYPDQPQV